MSAPMHRRPLDETVFEVIERNGNDVTQAVDVRNGYGSRGVSALGRLARDGKIERVGVGRYRFKTKSKVGVD